MLPTEVAAHATMHMDDDAYDTYPKLKRFVLKYVKVLRSLRRGTAKPARVVEVDGASTGNSGYNSSDRGTDEGDQDNGDDDEDRLETLLYEQLMTTEDVDRKIEILAIMKRKGFQPPTRGQGNRQRPPRAGPRNGIPGERAIPPRDRRDVICANCSRKGHTASECRQPKVDKANRKCFICDKTGHEARNCPEKGQQTGPRKDVNMIEANQGSVKVPVFVVCEKSCKSREVHRLWPVPQEAQLGDFIKTKKSQKPNSNRYQPLTLDDSVWSDDGIHEPSRGRST